MTGKVLLVDDDTRVLAGYTRHLRGSFDLWTASEARQGLDILQREGNFGVIISDMRMPGMDGIEFLGAVKSSFPNTARIMLTGHADQKTAIDAVNEANIFRFYTKPCPPVSLEQAIKAGLEQYNLITAGRTLLDQTLAGSVNMPNAWESELAAMLSPTGQIIMPDEVTAKVQAGKALTGVEREIAQMLRDRFGLALGKEKAYLLESQLNPVARKWHFAGFDELAQAIRIGNDEALLSDVTAAMTTDNSFFFRDQKPFDQFRDVVLPQLLERRAAGRSFRIWSAACSTGQEAYSLAMILKDHAQMLASWKLEIVATDISHEILDRAKSGLYSQFEVQRGLPIDLLVKYFKQTGDRWQLDDGVRKMVKFQYFNLLDNLAPLGKFDVVFCRNVLIYFDTATKTRVIENIANLLADDGFLYLGGAETVLGTSNRFQIVPGQRGVYSLACAF